MHTQHTLLYQLQASGGVQLLLLLQGHRRLVLLVLLVQEDQVEERLAIRVRAEGEGLVVSGPRQVERVERYAERVERYAEQVERPLAEQAERLYDAISELLARLGSDDDAEAELAEPPGTTQRQAHAARVVGRLRVARQVLDVVGVDAQVDRDLQADLAKLD